MIVGRTAMVRSLWMTALAAMLSLACAAMVANAQIEPWASRSDPRDVPRTFVQEVTGAPFTYGITQGGTVDGKMCTTLPGVWESYEQTWESNRTLRMENVGP